MTRNLAVELGPRNITTNTVAPGFFPSKLANGLIDILGGTDNLENDNPRKRLGQPEDIAGVMVYLCSPAASYMYVSKRGHHLEDANTVAATELTSPLMAAFAFPLDG